MKINNNQQQIDSEVDFLIWALGLEKEWKNTLPKFSDVEILKVFPEAKGVIPIKIKEWKEERGKIIDDIKQKLILIKKETSDKFSQWFWREWVKITDGQKLLDIDKYISRLKCMQLLSKGKKSKNSISQEQIDVVLNLPIEKIVSQHTELKRNGKHLSGLCPFHEEKRPSFFIYPDSNSFYCFSCQKGGNIINFVQELYNFSFREAVVLLSNY